MNCSKRRVNKEIIFALMGLTLTGFSLYKIYIHSGGQLEPSSTLITKTNLETSLQKKKSHQRHEDLSRSPANSEVERTMIVPIEEEKKEGNSDQINSVHSFGVADTSDAIKTLVTTESFFEEKETVLEDASLLVLATGGGFEYISSSDQSQSLSLASSQLLEATVGFTKTLDHELTIESGVLLTHIRYENPNSSQVSYGSGTLLNKGGYFRLHYALSRSFHLIPFFEYKQRKFVTSLSTGSYSLSSVWGPVVGLNFQWETFGNYKNRFYLLAGGAWLAPGQADTSDHRTKSGYSWNMGLRFQKIWQSFSLQIESMYTRLRQNTQLIHQSRQQVVLGIQLNFKL